MSKNNAAKKAAAKKAAKTVPAAGATAAAAPAATDKVEDTKPPVVVDETKTVIKEEEKPKVEDTKPPVIPDDNTPPPVKKRNKGVTLKPEAAVFVTKHLQNWFSEGEATELVPQILESVEHDEISAIIKDGDAHYLLSAPTKYSTRSNVQSLAAKHGTNLVVLFNQTLEQRGFIAEKH